MRLGGLIISIAPVLLCALTESAAGQAVVRGTVYDSLFSNGPLEGATVVVHGAPSSALTDRRGRFILRGLAPGRHAVSFEHPRFDSLQVGMPLREIEVGEQGTVRLVLATPSPRVASIRLCGQPGEEATAVLFGIVRSAEEGQPLVGAQAQVRWFEFEFGRGERRQFERLVTDSTRADGRFLLCGVPSDIGVTLEVSLGTQVTGPLHLEITTAALARRDVTLSLTDTAARHVEAPPPGDTVPFVRSPGSARLRVRVLNTQGRAVRGAIVGIRGTSATATTGDSGVVRLANVPAGSQTLVVRGIGLAPDLRVVDLRPGVEHLVEVDAERIAVLLPTMAVIGFGPDRVVAEYERRRKAGFGYFRQGKELENSASTVAFWYQFPGMAADAGSSGNLMPTMRGTFNLRCTPSVWSDGMRLSTVDGWELRGILMTAKRLEVYTTSSRTPAEFLTGSIDGCGAIVVWSR